MPREPQPGDPVAAAIVHLRAGQVVGVPTDTVYGVAADPLQPAAVEALFSIKGRDRSKPVGLLLADFASAWEWVHLPAYAAEWAERYWPGPLTLVARPRCPLPDGVGDHERQTVGVRVPDHPVIRALLEGFGPLAVTSANRSGEEATQDEVAAQSELGELVAFYVPGQCPGAVASTVVDVTSDHPRLLRAGLLDLGL